MSRSTDVGGVERRDSPPSLLLYNFDIDGDRLKLEHQEILRTVAVPISPWRQCHYCRLGKPYGIGEPQSAVVRRACEEHTSISPWRS